MKKLIAPLVLLPFTLFSTLVIVRHGYFGFLALAMREPWGMQMFLDLSIALFLVGGWMYADAKKRGINAFPYMLLLPFLGSVSALLYLLRRDWLSAPAHNASAISSSS